MERGDRLRRRGDFQRVYRLGVKVVGKYLVLFFVGAEGEGCRVGITVTKRIGRAVVRNRARRRIRELVRRCRGVLGNLGGDLVINARRGVSEAAWEVLEEDLRRCLERVRRQGRQ